MKTITEYLINNHVKKNVVLTSPAATKILDIFDLNIQDRNKACNEDDNDMLYELLVEQYWNIYAIACIDDYNKSNEGNIIAEGDWWFLGETVDALDDYSISF